MREGKSLKFHPPNLTLMPVKRIYKYVYMNKYIHIYSYNTIYFRTAYVGRHSSSSLLLLGCVVRGTKRALLEAQFLGTMTSLARRD